LSLPDLGSSRNGSLIIVSRLDSSTHSAKQHAAATQVAEAALTIVATIVTRLAALNLAIAAHRRGPATAVVVITFAATVVVITFAATVVVIVVVIVVVTAATIIVAIVRGRAVAAPIGAFTLLANTIAAQRSIRAGNLLLGRRIGYGRGRDGRGLRR
jgi:hypothetical protein